MKLLCKWWAMADCPARWGIVLGILLSEDLPEISLDDHRLLSAIVTERMYPHA